MALARTWNAAYEAIPANGDDALEGALRIRNLKQDIKERLAQDHIMNETDSDGLHNKVTMPEGSDPSTIANTGILYTKDVGGVTELFFKNSAGTVVQITSTSTVKGGIPSGSKMLFFNAAAPTGWTIDTSWDNHAIVIETTAAQGGSTGGSIDFTTLFAAGQTTSSSGAHTHTYSGTTSQPSGEIGDDNQTPATTSTDDHTHTYSGTTSSDGAHTHTLSLAVKYVKAIVCTKD